MKHKRVLWALAILLVGGVGVAAALLLANRRDVTTSSQAAYDAYQQAMLDQKRFYFKEARVGYAKALERYHLDMALANLAGKPEETLKLAHELHAQFPADPLGVGFLARAAVQRGDPDEAIRRNQELLAVDPNYAEAYNQIGYYYGYRGDYEKAIDNLERYRFISRDNANPFDSLGENQAYSGHYNEAIENLNRALAIKPDFAPAYQHLGVAYEGMGDYPKAVQMYEKAATFDAYESDKRGMLRAAVRASLNGGDRPKALELLDQIARLPKDPNRQFPHIDQEFLASVRELVEDRPADAERRLNALRPEIEAAWASYQKAGKIT